jgi:aminocarboxymuconate-semialdehyde decarboxylase
MPRWDLHTHYYPQAFSRLIEEAGGDFSFAKSPTGQTIISYRGARFFGITPPMTDARKRIEDMHRAGIDVEVLSLSTPNVYFAPPERQAEVARLVNDAYAELIAREPKRFKGVASIPMDDPDTALRQLERALGELRLSGVIVLSNINGRALTDARYRPFFEECNRRQVCVFIHPMIPPNGEYFAEYVLGPIVGFPFYLFERLDSGWAGLASIDELPSVYLRRLYYDTVSFSGPSLRLALEQVGAEHLVMGSDYPHMLGSIERSVTSIEALDISAADKDRIFSGTAQAVLNNV